MHAPCLSESKLRSLKTVPSVSSSQAGSSSQSVSSCQTVEALRPRLWLKFQMFFSLQAFVCAIGVLMGIVAFYSLIAVVASSTAHKNVEIKTAYDRKGNLNSVVWMTENVHPSNGFFFFFSNCEKNCA